MLWHSASRAAAGRRPSHVWLLPECPGEPGGDETGVPARCLELLEFAAKSETPPAHLQAAAPGECAIPRIRPVLRSQRAGEQEKVAGNVTAHSRGRTRPQPSRARLAIEVQQAMRNRQIEYSKGCPALRLDVRTGGVPEGSAVIGEIVPVAQIDILDLGAKIRKGTDPGPQIETEAVLIEIQKIVVQGGLTHIRPEINVRLPLGELDILSESRSRSGKDEHDGQQALLHDEFSMPGSIEQRLRARFVDRHGRVLPYLNTDTAEA